MKEYEIIAFPTVSLESIFTTLLIDEKEGQDVATFDVQGAFLHPDYKKDEVYFMLMKWMQRGRPIGL